MAKKTSWDLEILKLPKMSKEDWVLLILARQEKGSCGALMNDVFFFIKEFTPAMEGQFGFRGTGFGPYSKGVANAVNKLISDDFIEVEINKNTGTCYCSLNDKGKSRCETLFNKIPKSEQDRIKFAEFLARRMGAMGTQQYLNSVYPEYVFIHGAGDTPV